MPAFAAPIRVGIFKGTGWRWTSSTHVAARAIDSMLADPGAANLGPDRITTPDGFVTRIFGVVDTPGADTRPTFEQKAAFLDALDSLDVVVFPSNSNFGGVFDQPQQRGKLKEFFETRGVVSLAWSIDRSESWGAWDSLHGARFGGWMCVCTATLRRDTAAEHDPVWRLLNRGLPDTARFSDEWLRYITSAADIRAIPGLGVTMRLDSASGGFNSARADHPYSWYRELPEGGRFFYSGNGYRAQNFTGAPILDSAGDAAVANSRYFRRQLYNAILWAAGADSNGIVPVRGRAAGEASTFTDAARVSFSGSTLAVSMLKDGAHVVEIRSLDGRLVASRRGEGRVVHAFAELRPGTVYAVRVARSGESFARLVTTP